ncbi:hypothetical protein ACFO4O_17300 [Glaciecola siphonariae]|uniref:SGNH/GDSL hydrolase family protein n=1 Tax=Glaciecola siphonariae TaxID=521012 RepID=A0ABV9M1X7_9ALTE
MMSKLLLISDSNAASVKDAANQGLLNLDIDIDYLPLSGKNAALLNELSLEGNMLTSEHESVKAIMTRNGFLNTGIDLREYSYVVIFGFQLFSSGNGSNWIAIVDDQDKFLSQAVRKATPSIYDNICATFHLEFIKRLKTVDNEQALSHLNVFSIASPLPNQGHPGWRGVIGKRSSPLNAYEQQAQEICEGFGVQFVTLPTRLLANNGYSAAKEFWYGNAKDFSHLNAQGAAILMEHFAALANIRKIS